MADESTTTSLSDLLPSIVYQALFIAQERSLMRSLVRNYNMPNGAGTTVTVPIYPVLTAVDLTEAVDMANTLVTTTSSVLTVGEVGIKTLITDLARRTAAADVVSDIGGQMGKAVATKIDQDLTALFPGFTTNVLGDGTLPIAATDIYNAVAKLRSRGLDMDDMVCVIHPNIAYDLNADISGDWQNTNSNVATNQILVQGFLGSLAGIPVFQSANIAEVAGDSIGAVFHKEALGLALLADISMETERDASLRGDELVAVATYGVGELIDEYGVALNFDSSIQA